MTLTHDQIAREYWLTDEQYDAIVAREANLGNDIDESAMSFWTIPYRRLVGHLRDGATVRVYDEGNVRVMVEF